jgi:hypothetical protein
VTRMPVDPDAGIPDLVRRLSDDSKRLLGDEVRLARLELKENIKRGGKGALLLGVAFGVGAVAAVLFTLFLATAIGRLAGGHMWVGALVTGIVEIGVGALLIKRGASRLGAPSYSFEQTREAVRG